MFRAYICPSSGENYCIYATLVFSTLYGWRLVCWLEFHSNRLVCWLEFHYWVHNSVQYIYFSCLNVSASMCPSSGENYCIYSTLVFVTLYGWRLVCWLEFHSNRLICWLEFHFNQQTRHHPYRVTNTSVA